MKKTILITLIIWVIFHIPGIFYGTSNVPLHASYVTADEQSPINGALHILEDKSLLALKNLTTLYYGPIFAIIALPAVLADFAYQLLSGGISAVSDYRDFVVWNWGGIIIWSRLITVLVSYLGLVAVYQLFRTGTLNPLGIRLVPWVAVIAIALNYQFFVYTNSFRHWPFILAILFWQIYLAIKIVESDNGRKKYWIWQIVLSVISFGISYLGIIYNIFWLPILIKWLKEKDVKKLQEFGLYIFAFLIGFAVIWAWHPYSFIRTLGLVGLVDPVTSLGSIQSVTGTDEAGNSFGYYARVLLINNWALVLAGLILIGYAVRNRVHQTKYWLWAMLIPAILNYVVFSIPSHHEARYVLPTIVLLVLAVIGLLASYWDQIKLRQITLTLIGLSFVLNLVSIIGWERMMLAGPMERRTIIPQILEWQRENRDNKTLSDQNWILGAAHTKAGYEDFVYFRSKADSDLWRYILSHEPPQNVPKLNVYYSTTTKIKFDHIVRRNTAQVEPDIFDVNPWKVWNYTKYQDSYTIVK